MARWELARAYMYLKRYYEAIVHNEMLLKEKPQLEEARTELAKVLFWRGRNAEALAALEEIPPARLPDRAKVLLGDRYAAGKRYHQARQYYRLLQDPPVDRLILSPLESLRASDGGPLTQALRVEGPRARVGRGQAVSLFEAVSRNLSSKDGLIGPSDRLAIETILIERLPTYPFRKGSTSRGR